MADRDCVHGQLARVCELCEKDAEIAALRTQLEQAQDKFTKTILAAKGQAVDDEDERDHGEVGVMDEKTVESARAEFEKWVKNPHMLGRCHAPGSEDRYEVSETQYAWRAWQAAIAAYLEATGVERDAERLAWMIERSARVMYSMDGEDCWVEYESGEPEGRGYARVASKRGLSPIEAIDSARGGEHG